MKEKLYTIPLNDAVNAMDECPFCNIERKIEQDMMDFVLGSGSSYMEKDVRLANLSVHLEMLQAKAPSRGRTNHRLSRWL